MLLLQGGHAPALGAWPWIRVGGFNRNPLLFSSTSIREKIKSGPAWGGAAKLGGTGAEEDCGLGFGGHGPGELGKMFPS